MIIRAPDSQPLRLNFQTEALTLHLIVVFLGPGHRSPTLLGWKRYFRHYRYFPSIIWDTKICMWLMRLIVLLEPFFFPGAVLLIVWVTWMRIFLCMERISNGRIA